MSAPGHDVSFTHSNFGGGWIVPATARGREALETYFGEPAEPLAPIGGALGYVVEPQDVEDLAEYTGRARLIVEL